ncbi:MAG: hypothetical protein DRJ03_16870 [Chloroflexi bacterium]|nr:MAG: hypothetical protein DRJ03_16870 [Chloroflexota bacterium]
MKKAFKVKKFRGASLELISTCNDILHSYEQQGYDLSLRQLYYQLVSKDLVPNTQKSYSRLGDIASDARLAGLMDWDMIVDRGRSTVRNSHWESPAEILQTCASSFQIDKWEDQPYHVEVMVEKQALEGVIIPVCSKLDVSFTANKGYSSQSFMYRKGQQLNAYASSGKKIVAIYLGDHDPSGLDMDRDIRERLQLFSGHDVELTRVALTHAQVLQYQPPPNPAKVTDSRADKYIQKFGQVSWELDALDPATLAGLVEGAVKKYRDDTLWDVSVVREKKMKVELSDMARDYTES